MTHVCRVVVVLLLSVLPFLGTTTSPASAHVALVWSFPSAGASLPHPPAEVALDASDAVDLGASQIVVRDALGVTQPLRGLRLARDGTVLLGGLDGGGARGQWELDFRLVGVDGHAVTGRIDFAVGQPATADDERSGGLGLWAVLGGGGALIAAAWFLRRSTVRSVGRPARRPVRAS